MLRSNILGVKFTYDKYKREVPLSMDLFYTFGPTAQRLRNDLLRKSGVSLAT